MLHQDWTHPFDSSENWDVLKVELDSWADAGLQASFWWRDDDARAHTPALERLLQLSETLAVPVALAVIPMSCDRGLEMRLRDEAQIAILQHGIHHINRAPATEKKTEIWAGCDTAQMSEALCSGARRLAMIFARPLPVLVPPWNRIGDNHLARLADAGFTGLSTFGIRGTAGPPLTTPANRPPIASNTLHWVNCHVDPIAWRADRGFVGERQVLQQLIDHLRARRQGDSDRTEPIGLLTHHLVHDEAVWRFVQRLLAQTTSHRAVRWLGAETVFCVRGS